MEKMLVTQALDERDLLVKKINDKIAKASFVDTIKGNEEKVFDARVTREEFAQATASAYQQIVDLIERYQRIDAAITASNANTMISTSYGEYSVAAGISLRGRLRCSTIYNSEANFENTLCLKIKEELSDKLLQVDEKNSALMLTADNMRMSILGKETKVKDDKPLAVVDAYVSENTTVLVDPIDVQKKIDALLEKQTKLLAEIDTAIKVSNATTFVEF